MKNKHEETQKEWTTVIKPRTGLFEVDFRELGQYKDLWYMFIKRDIITQYKQTILGPLWFFINPALTTIMYMVVFGGIAGISTDGLPQPLFYLSGICFWNYFATCLTRTSATFNDNQHVFGKVYFPRLVVPLSVVVSSLLILGIQLLLFIGVYIYYMFTGVGIAPTMYILLLPVLIFMLAGLGLGFGILVSSLTTKYRDLTILFSFIVQLWMYATPIIYPLNIMSPGRQWIMALNPVTSIIETFKYAAFGSGVFNWLQLMYSFGFMVIIVCIGVVVFNKTQRNFMDTV